MPAGPAFRDPWGTIFGSLKTLRTAWPTRGWSWDSRLSCVTSSFNAELRPKARMAAMAALPGEWAPGSIGRAPHPIRDVATRTGELRSGQLILVSTQEGAAFAYGLWWPWGDEITTSIRIGLDGIDVSSDAFQRFRDVFGVEL
jgi:hypothetical protein